MHARIQRRSARDGVTRSSEERQAELQGYLDRWAAETDHGDRKGPFDLGPNQFTLWLTGADVSWFAYQPRGDRLHLEQVTLIAHIPHERLVEFWDYRMRPEMARAASGVHAGQTHEAQVSNWAIKASFAETDRSR